MAEKKVMSVTVTALSGSGKSQDDLFREQVAANIESLLEQKEITQKKLSEETGYAESCISDYKKGNKLPPLAFFLEIKRKYGISIDDFLTRNITPADYKIELPTNALELEELEDYKRFEGSYYVYYFDTSNYKGRDFSNAEESLMFGVVHIYGTPSPVSYLDHSCICVFGISDRERADSIKEKIDSFSGDNDAIEDFITENFPENAYYGDFNLTKNHAFLSLTHKNKDKALVIFHRPPSNKSHYNGGIGTINSVSRGREPMPVVQFIGMSREKLSLSCEEIHRLLLLSYPSLKAKDEVDELISTFKNLYMESGSISASLTEFQKKVALTADLERFARKSLENNMFRIAKISNRDDDAWYHGLRNQFSVNEGEFFI